MVAVAVVGSAVAGVAGSAIASKRQADAAGKAADVSDKMYQQTRADLLPYNEAGQYALNNLTANLGYFTAPVKMTKGELVRTPGYQWNLQQGLKAVQNSAAARGLGSSGAALKGAASYATGLADSTYQNQWQNEVANRQNAYNRLMGLSELGQNAAAQTGAQGTQAAAQMGNAYISQGNAQAAGIMGAANAISGGINNYMGYNMLKGMYGS